MCRVLILHGWLHSAERYSKLKLDLEKHRDYIVDVYKFPGFGGENPLYDTTEIIETYATLVCDILTNVNYDVIIGHSMGGTVLLRVLALIPIHAHVILLCPVYKGMSEFRPLIKLFPLYKKYCARNKFLSKCLALPTVSNWNLIDDLLITDVIRADLITAKEALVELVNDTFSLSDVNVDCTKVIVVGCANDPIVSRRSLVQLCKDLSCPTEFVYLSGGHTVVLDNYYTLLDLVLSCLQDIC